MLAPRPYRARNLERPSHHAHIFPTVVTAIGTKRLVQRLHSGDQIQQWLGFLLRAQNTKGACPQAGIWIKIAIIGNNIALTLHRNTKLIQTNKQTNKQTKKERKKERSKERKKERKKETNKQINKQINKQSINQSINQSIKQTINQSNKQTPSTWHDKTWSTYIRTYVHTYIHTFIHTYIHTYIRTCLHACIHAFAFMHVYSRWIMFQLFRGHRLAARKWAQRPQMPLALWTKSIWRILL